MDKTITSSSLTPISESNTISDRTVWNDTETLERIWKVATFLCKSDLVPDLYKGKPENCLIAADMANRTGMAPLAVMQNLYVVKGKPCWSGQMCIALINGCKRFTPLEFIYRYDADDKVIGCYAQATRISTGEILKSEEITIEMAKNEGWLDKTDKYGKNISKWATMPKQMMTYRAGAFFGRVYCPDMLIGIQTVDEINDINH